VEVAEKLPHAALPQVTVHLTPALALSLATTAVRLAVVPVVSDAGGAGVRVTVMAGVMEMLADATLVPSVTDIAVTVTEATGVLGAV
jgi:hypothetical protein